MDSSRGILAVSLQAVMVAIALTLQIFGVFVFPFHLVPFSFSEPVYGYQSPLVVLPFLIAFVLIAASVIAKIIHLNKNIRSSDSSILAYSTMLSSLPAWVVFWASQVELHTDFMWVYNPHMSLLPGSYVYIMGCIILVASQIVVPFAAKGNLPTSAETSRWIERNRGSLIGAILLMTAAPFFLWVKPALLAASSIGFFLAPAIWFVVVILAEIAMGAYVRRRFKDSQRFQLPMLVPWALLLTMIPASLDYFGWDLFTPGTSQTIVSVFIVGQLSTLIFAFFSLYILFRVDTRIFRSKTHEMLGAMKHQQSFSRSSARCR
jgi:hypothetical protein